MAAPILKIYVMPGLNDAISSISNNARSIGSALPTSFFSPLGTVGKILGSFGGLGSLAGAALNFWSQSNTNRQVRELAEQQNQLNYEQWLRQNNYDLPKEQMKRFIDAGLNPNLIYGGLSSGSTAQPMQSGFQNQVAPEVDLNSMLAASQIEVNKSVAKKNTAEAQMSVTEMQQILGDTPLSRAQVANITAQTNELVQRYNTNRLTELINQGTIKFLYDPQHTSVTVRYVGADGKVHEETEEGLVVPFEQAVKDNFFSLFADKKLSDSMADYYYAASMDAYKSIDMKEEQMNKIKAEARKAGLDADVVENFLNVCVDYYKGLTDQATAAGVLAQNMVRILDDFKDHPALFQVLFGNTNSLLNLAGSIAGTVVKAIK